ncbi:hypothetical protein KFL_013700010 [Klebsormidium nitens]|uniref:Uncharacterized protein n=1 Tax=Klebsormidium nitens TaxID=105231 RepID=A0A1Y1IT05_KLENI|nr:hypothetical protein KFL_013700010 [Klebsormidium nitens]|eukprot:GAQ93222.1 hypothetical protein KFL_013700010 [Klebsormidium nitens]
MALADSSLLLRWLDSPDEEPFPMPEERRVGNLLRHCCESGEVPEELLEVLPNVSSLLVEEQWTQVLADFGFEKLSSLTSYQQTSGYHASLRNFDQLVRLNKLIIRVNPADFESLAESLRNFSQLKFLSLRYNNILRREAEMLAAALPSLSALETLDLSACSIGWVAYHEFLCRAKDEPKADPKTWKILLVALAKVGSLRMLNLSKNNLRGEAGKVLASHLPSLRQLSVLVIGDGQCDCLFDNRITSKHVYSALLQMTSLDTLGTPSRDEIDVGFSDLDSLFALPMNRLRFKTIGTLWLEQALERHAEAGNLETLESWCQADEKRVWRLRAEQGTVFRSTEFTVRGDHDLLDKLCTAAAKGGQLPVIEWTEAKGLLRYYHCDQFISPAAASRAHLHILQWLKKKGCLGGRYNKNTCSAAAYDGHLAVLQWARANGVGWDKQTCASAAAGGHMEWATENGCPWGEDIGEVAAECGRVDILQWLAANGLQWSTDICAAAAAGGHLNVLEWACKEINWWVDVWDEATCDRALEEGRKVVFLWALEQGCPWSGSTLDMDNLPWILEYAKDAFWNLFLDDQKRLSDFVAMAAEDDDVDTFRQLREGYERRSEDESSEEITPHMLKTGPKCAQVLLQEGYTSADLDPATVLHLEQALYCQTIAGVVLKHRVGLPREVMLKIFELANFVWLEDRV